MSLLLKHISKFCSKTDKKCLLIPAFLHTGQRRNVEIESDDHFQESQSLYEGHKSLSPFQSILLSLGSSVVCLLDPSRHDLVAVLSETTGQEALGRIRDRMKEDEEGTDVLRDRPRINSNTVDYDVLSSLPPNTFGFAYAQFLSRNGVTPDSRLQTQFVDDEELAYVIQRYREVHDLVHTVLGMPTNMLGEVVVKWVEALQTGLPMCIGGALFGPIRLRPKQRVKYTESLLPWALRVGQTAKPLMNLYFEQRWEQDLTDLRRERNIEEPPIKI